MESCLPLIHLVLYSATSMSYRLLNACNILDHYFITARKRSLGQGNMFTGVCLSTGGEVPDHVHPQEQTPAQEQTHPPPPSTEHAGRYGQRAGGTHPTGMQSCLILVKYIKSKIH